MDLTQKKKHYLMERANRPTLKFLKKKHETRIRVDLFKKTFAFPFATELQ
jgi:hypothetical protein